MALGTITPKNLEPQLGGSGGTNGEVANMRLGGLLMTRNLVVGDSSYPTGGTSLTPDKLGFGTAASPGVVLFTLITLAADTGSNNAAVEARYDDVAQKLQCFDMTNTNASYAANQSHTTIECPNATNLSGLTWNIVAFGFPGLS